MAGGTGQDTFAKTPVGVKDVRLAEDVQIFDMGKKLTKAVNTCCARPGSLLSVLFGTTPSKFFGRGWTRREVSNELMLEFVKVTRKKNRLRGQQKRRTALRKLLELDRKLLKKNILLDRNVKEAKMKAIDVKIQRNVQIAAKKYRQIAKCQFSLQFAYDAMLARERLMQ